MKKRTAILVAAILMAMSLSACAEDNCKANSDGHCTKSTEDPNVITTNLARKISELTQRINSNDAAMRAAAIEIALCDESQTIRGIAIAAALSRFNSLTPEIIMEKESALEPGDLPNIVTNGIRWGSDMHSFEGTIDLPPLGNTVRGQITGDLLAISFQRVKIATSLLQQRNKQGAANTDNTNSDGIITSCTAHLAPNSSRNALEGDMTCVKLPIKLRIRLGFLG